MTKIHHLNCGILHAPPNPQASCHCLLLEDEGRLALIDTGIGLLDVAHPLDRIGQPIIEAAGFQFQEENTAARQLEKMGYSPAQVGHIVLTHADPDHTGGLADFPGAMVHLSAEEHLQGAGGQGRYLASHFAHQPQWRVKGPSANRWFGLEARAVDLGFQAEVFLVPLFGHTLGHCGVAIRQDSRWLLHVGDAYYLRVELTDEGHPVGTLAALRAEDDRQRRKSLAELRRLYREHAGEIEMFGYHDFSEFPSGSMPA